MTSRFSFALAMLAAVSALLALAPDAVQATLEYNRFALESGELWRLWTGHLVHADGLHALTGVASMAALAWWWRGEPGPGPTQGMGFLLVAALALSAGLYGFVPNMSHYRGLSGLLFCLLTCALLQPGTARAGLPPALRHGMAGVLALKLIWDAFQMATAGSAGVGGTESVVAVEAHLLGAMLGALWLTGIAAWTRRQRLHAHASGTS